MNRFAKHARLTVSIRAGNLAHETLYLGHQECLMDAVHVTPGVLAFISMIGVGRMLRGIESWISEYMEPAQTYNTALRFPSPLLMSR